MLPVETLSPFKKWALNVVGLMPKSKRGKRLLITIINYFTLLPVAWAVAKDTARGVIRFIGINIISLFIKPKFLITNDVPRWFPTLLIPKAPVNTSAAL